MDILHIADFDTDDDTEEPPEPYPPRSTILDSDDEDESIIEALASAHKNERAAIARHYVEDRDFLRSRNLK